MATVVTITPNTLLDHLARTRIAPGVVNRVAQVEPLAGGKGLNVGRVLAAHGHRVRATGFVGQDAQTAFAALVAADGQEPEFIAVAARQRIGFLAVDATRGETTSLLESGFAVAPAEVGRLLDRVRGLIQGADLVIAAGSVPDPAVDGLYRLVLDACHHANVPCWIDAYGPAMDRALAGAHPPQLAKPNAAEYGPEPHTRWNACRELHRTDGGGTVRVRHPDGRCRVTPPVVTEVNPVGSGDCYLAGLAHARLAGLPLADQLAYAAAAGAANAARADVARIGPADIAPLIGAAQVVRE